jgi:hypothetical protein
MPRRKQKLFQHAAKIGVPKDTLLAAAADKNVCMFTVDLCPSVACFRKHTGPAKNVEAAAPSRNAEQQKKVNSVAVGRGTVMQLPAPGPAAVPLVGHLMLQRKSGAAWHDLPHPLALTEAERLARSAELLASNVPLRHG